MPAGRPRGTTNRDSNEARRIIEKVLGMPLPQAWAEALRRIKDNHPEAQCAVYEKMMRYCYPALASMQITMEKVEEDKTQYLEDLKAKFRVISSE